MTAPDGPASERDRPSFLVVSQYFPPERGAAQVRLGAMVAELARTGHQVEVITAVPNYPTAHLFPGWSRRPLQDTEESGARVLRVWVWAAIGSGLGRMVNYLSFAVMSVFALARATPADWTFIEYPSLPGALPALWWSRLRHRRTIVNVADLWVDTAIEVEAIPRWTAPLARRLERWLLLRADVVCAVTHGVAEALLAKGVPPERLRLLPNGVDVDLFTPGPVDPTVRPELGVDEGDHLVIYAGTHGYVHRLDVVLDAAALLRDVAVTIVLVGDGSEKARLRRRITAQGLDNVRLADPVAPERVADYFRAASVGLATVRAGVIYRSVRSAKMFPVMASGVPLVYAAEDEGSALVERVGAGIVTAPDDGQALADAVRTLVADDELRREMGARGRAHATAEGDWKQIIATWLADLDTDGPVAR